MELVARSPGELRYRLCGETYAMRLTFNLPPVPHPHANGREDGPGVIRLYQVDRDDRDKLAEISKATMDREGNITVDPTKQPLSAYSDQTGSTLFYSLMSMPDA